MISQEIAIFTKPTAKRNGCFSQAKTFSYSFPPLKFDIVENVGSRIASSCKFRNNFIAAKTFRFRYEKKNSLPSNHRINHLWQNLEFSFSFSPKALAHYLKLLDADDAKFNEYFWWRDFYARRFRHHQSLCDVCERLHTDKSTKIYDNMQEWWVNQAHCSSNHIISQDDMI